MNVFKFLLAALCLTVVSCVNGNKEEVHSDLRSTDTTIINEGGTKKYIITYPLIEGKKDVIEDIGESGYSITQYMNQKKVKRGSMFHGIRVGYWYMYDSLELVEEVQHLIPDVVYQGDSVSYPQSILNQRIFWDSEGEIDKNKSFYYNLITKSDTYSISDSIYFDLEYHSYNKGSSILFQYGQFTNPFYFTTPESRKKKSHLIPFDDMVNCSVRAPADKIGENAFIGAIVDRNDSDTIRIMYVKYRYFVNP